MKILQVITSLHTGGAEKLIVDIVPRLRAVEHEVDVCLFNGENTPFKEQLEQCGCVVYSLSMNDKYYSPVKIIKLWRIMRHYDIVHTHNTAPQLFAAIAGVVCSVVLVTTEHTTSNRRRGWKWYKLLDRWMYNQYKKVICISKQAESNIKDYLKTYKTSITTIFNGVDVAFFHDSHGDLTFKEGSNRFVIVMVAGFRYQKDQDTLVKAMKFLDKDKYELWLVGDGERRIIVEALAKELNVRDQVRFWGNRSDVATILQTSDIVVMSSHWEGLSLSNIEGMSAGKPFIASDVDGLREVTEGAGLLFPHQDDRRLAEIIMELHDDHELYNKIADACYEKAKQFDISKMVAAYSEVYQKILY